MPLHLHLEAMLVHLILDASGPVLFTHASLYPGPARQEDAQIQIQTFLT
jgi:hypothetical protein